MTYSSRLERPLPTLTDEQEKRFWAHVDKNGPIHPRLGTPCWLWDKPAAGSGGYGRVTIARRNYYPHRISAHMAGHGLIGFVARHQCDNKLCVNPDHLLPGTDQQNIREAFERGVKANPAGDACPNSKLTSAQALEAYNDPDPYRLIAAKHGVGIGAIKAIKRGQTWFHVTGHKKPGS